MAGSSPQSNSNSTETPTIRARINDELRSRGVADLDDEERLHEDEEHQIEMGMKVNVFDHCQAHFVEKGDVIQYDIDRNGQFVATKMHPYSWEALQKEFGEGHYRVQAKSAHTKAYRKQESRFVAAAPRSERDKESSIADAVRSALPQQPDQFDQLTKVATLLKSLTPPPPSLPEDKTSGVLLEMMKFMSDTTQKSQESTMRMIEKMQENTTKMIEKIDTTTKEMFNKIETKIAGDGKSGKQFDALQLLQMLQKAEERGMNTYLKIEELAEKKAARMGGDKDEDKEPESATERLVKSVLPAISAALAAKPQVPMHRPQPPRQIRQAVPGARVVPSTAPAQPQVNQPRPQPTPQAGPKTPQVMPAPSKQEVVEKISAGVFQRLIEASAVQNDPAAVKQTQVKAAEDVSATIKKLGITIPQLLQMIPQGDMIDIATSAGLPNEAHHWLEGFYAHLKELARAQQPTPQPKPQPAVAPAANGSAQPSVGATQAEGAQPVGTQRVSG